MFDRIAPVYDVMNRVMTAGLDRRWRRLTVEAVVQPGERVLDACCGTGDLAVAAERAGGIVTGLDFSGGCSSARGASPRTIDWVQGDLLALPFADGVLRRGHGRLRCPQRRRSRRRAARAAARAASGRRARRFSRSRSPRGLLRPFFSLWFDRIVPLLGRVLPGGEAYTYLPASVRRFPGAEELARALERAGFGDVRFRLFGGAIVALHTARRRERDASTRSVDTPGLGEYLEAVEERLAETVASHPGLVADVGADALAAGGKRLRPLLAFLLAPPGRPPPIAAGVAVELVHLATLVHDDLIDGAGSVAAARRPGRRTARTPPAPPATTSSRARSPSSPDRRPRGRRGARGRVARARPRRGAAAAPALRPRRRPSSAISSAARSRPESCSRRPACSAAAAASTACCLGVAFQIADDILDCTGDTIETGKVAGHRPP